MDLKLRGKTALVTGASRGLGQMVARMLAMEGVKVAAAARRVELIEESSREIVAAGGEKLTAIKADFYAAGASEKLAKEATDALGGKVEILMNVAGGTRPTTIEAKQEVWDEAMLLNFIRPRELTHAIVPGMRAGKWGRIVSFTGTSEPREMNAVSSAKAAMHSWAKMLAREVAADEVTVNSLQPGRIHSEQIAKHYPPAVEQEFAQKTIPLRRFGEPEEIGAVAVFLASPIAGYITGTVIPVDGGLKMYAF